MVVLLLSLKGASAGERKSQLFTSPVPEFSATQNQVLATLGSQVFELPPSDSVWKVMLTSIPGPLLASDSFHYFGNGSLIGATPRGIPDIASFPNEWGTFRFGEDAQRFYLCTGRGEIFQSDKSAPGWKPLHTAPPFSESYQLFTFPNHYLLAGTFEIWISRNRGADWERIKDIPDVPGSSHFVKKIGDQVFASPCCSSR